MKCFFTSDLHGKVGKYKKLFELAMKESPNALFIGGDVLPGGYGAEMEIQEFFHDFFLPGLQELKDSFSNMRVFVIMGNDDPRYYEPRLIDADSRGLLNYVHDRVAILGDYFVVGYSFIPPSPFQLKDWERYDISRFVDVGASSPEAGMRTVDVSEESIRYETIANDLERLIQFSSPERTIYLFHSPPYDCGLDVAEYDGRKVDHAPMDVHVGSIAIKRFISDKQPLLTLHGHVHESYRLTGIWRERTGRSYSFSGAHDGPELALVRFDTEALEVSSRELILPD